MKRKRKTDKEKAFEQMTEAIAIFLSTIGWQVIVIGSPRIQHQSGEARTFNYEFVVRFTGKQIEKPQSAGSNHQTPPGHKSKSLKDPRTP